MPGCRALAQTYHPDKQPDERRKEAAAASFTRMQEAYEVSLLGAFVQQDGRTCKPWWSN